MRISDKTIECLGGLITGDTNITEYKTGYELVRFFNKFGFNDEYGQGFPSRWYYAEQKIKTLNGTKKLQNLLESYFNPINFIDNEFDLSIIVELLNKYLEYDGYKIIIKEKNCKVVECENGLIEVENEGKIGYEFAKEQIKKCQNKIEEKDFDGAISNSRSLLESALADIYKKITKKDLNKTGDLLKDFKTIAKLLNLSEEKYSEQSLKSILRGFNSIINGIDSLSNKMGDRHRRIAKPERHHAKLCVNSAKIVIDFLYDTFEYQNKQKK